MAQRAGSVPTANETEIRAACASLALIVAWFAFWRYLVIVKSVRAGTERRFQLTVCCTNAAVNLCLDARRTLVEASRANGSQYVCLSATRAFAKRWSLTVAGTDCAIIS